MAYTCSLSSLLLSPVPNITLLPSSFPSSSLPFPKRSLLSATKFRAFASASAPSSCPTPDVVVTREQGKNAKLIDALMLYLIGLSLLLQKLVWSSLKHGTTGQVLAAELPNDGGSTCKVLYPASIKAGNEIEEGLTDRGFKVTRLNTYNTEPVQQVDHTVLKQALSAPVLAVASPSAIRAWINLVPKSESWDKSVACIGQTTALAAKKLGLKNVYYPDNPGLDGWVESILEALRMHEKVEKALTC